MQSLSLALTIVFIEVLIMLPIILLLRDRILNWFSVHTKEQPEDIETDDWMNSARIMVTMHANSMTKLESLDTKLRVKPDDRQLQETRQHFVELTRMLRQQAELMAREERISATTQVSLLRASEALMERYLRS